MIQLILTSHQGALMLNSCACLPSCYPTRPAGPGAENRFWSYFSCHHFQQTLYRSKAKIEDTLTRKILRHHVFLNRVRDRSRRPKGVNGSRSKFLRNSNRRPISQKSLKPSSVLTKVWSSYRKAKPTEKASNGERNHEANRKRIERKQQTSLPGPV